MVKKIAKSVSSALHHSQWRRVGEPPSVLHLFLLACLELLKDCEELGRVSESTQDMPKSISSHSVKCLHQVNKGGVDPCSVTYTSLEFYEVRRSYHFCSSPVGSETTLAFW